MQVPLTTESLGPKFPDAPVSEFVPVRAISQRYQLGESIQGARGRGCQIDYATTEIGNRRNARHEIRGKFDGAMRLISDILARETARWNWLPHLPAYIRRGILPRIAPLTDLLGAFRPLALQSQHITIRITED